MPSVYAGMHILRSLLNILCLYVYTNLFHLLIASLQQHKKGIVKCETHGASKVGKHSFSINNQSIIKKCIFSPTL